MRVLSFDELKSQKGIKLSREQIRQKRKAKTFPEPLAIGENSVAWLESDIDRWIESLPRAAAAAEHLRSKSGVIADERQTDLPLQQETVG